MEIASLRKREIQILEDSIVLFCPSFFFSFFGIYIKRVSGSVKKKKKESNLE